MSSNLLLTLKPNLLDLKFQNNLDKLKNELEITTDELLMEYLLCQVEDEIRKSKYYLIASNKTYIKTLYDYIKIFVGENRKMNIDYVNRKIAHITKYIDLQLYEFKQNKNLQLFKSFWTYIDQLNSSTKKYIKNKIEYNNKNRFQQMSKYELLWEVIFKYKSINLLKQLRDKNKDIFLTKDSEGNPFFSELIITYINTLMDNNSSIRDIMIYETIINIFLSEPKLTIESKIKQLVEEKDSNYKEANNYHNNRAIYLSHLRRKITGDKKFVDSIDELNKKYNVDIHIPNYNNKILSEHVSYILYEDMNNKNVITIDDADTKTVDDGISIDRLENGNYCLGIYIADVSKSIRHSSAYDIEALNCISSMYCGAIPIKKMILSDSINNECSLLPGDSKGTVACFFEIDNYGNIVNHSFKRVAVTIKDECRLSYNKVDAILKKERDDSEVNKTLIDLKCISEKGAFNTLTTDNMHKDNTINSQVIICKMMTLINHMFALEAKKKGIPFIYNAYQDIDKSVLENYSSLDKITNAIYNKTDKALKEKIYNSMSTCYYTPKPIPHKEMNNNVYGTVSSPLRRYVDLLNQRLFCLFTFNDKIISDKEIYMIEDVLNEITKYLNENKCMRDKYEYDYAHIKK